MFHFTILVLIVYLVFVFIKYKQIPTSLSDTYYLGAGWLFTIVIWTLGFLSVASLITITPILYQFLPFLLGSGLLFVGAAPRFKESYQTKIHYGGAIVFGLASNIWACLYFSPWVLLTWLSAIYLVPFSTKRTFWIEMICVINLIIAYEMS